MEKGIIRMYKIELMLVVVLGMLWLSTIPSSAQFCWKKIADCLTHSNQTSNAELDVKSPSFNRSEFFCCPLMQQTAQSDKICFCTMNSYIHSNPQNGTAVLTVLNICNITDSDSLASFDAFCSVVPTSPSTPPPAPVVSSPPPPAPINSLPPSTSPASDSTLSHAVNKKTVIIVVAVSSAIVVVLMTLGAVLYNTKARKKPHGANSETENNLPPGELPNVPRPPPAPVQASQDDIITPESLQYEFGALKGATNNFCKDHKIGQGGFGAVYKGTLPNGQVVAIKRLSRGSWQGDKEFKSETVLVAKLQHRNLVRLVGFCLAKEEMLLVYEFMENKSLDQLLFDHEKQKQLSW